MIQVEWADYKFLNEPESFMLTKKLFDLENELGKDTHDSLHWSRRFEYPWVYAKLQPFGNSDIVLDAGAGNTVFQFLISKQVKELHSIDANLSCVDWVSSKAKQFANVFSKQADILHLPFPNGFFDKVVCISALEHNSKQQIWAAISELTRVTKPAGKIAITMDIALETTDKQFDITDLGNMAKEHSIPIPSLPNSVIGFRTISYSFPLAVCCMLIQKESS